MANKEAWLQLVRRSLQKGSAIFEGSRLADTNGELSNPSVVAVTLLARTLGNANAALILIENRCIVEARTLVRCCYENFFWIAALTKLGEEFVAQIGLDDVTNRIKRGNALLQWSATQEQAPDFEQKLRTFITDLEASEEKPGAISLFNAAGAGGIVHSYLFYRELSTDAAHPSAASLSRHISQAGDRNFTLQPRSDEREDENTLELLCSALIGTCVAAQDILEKYEFGEPIGDLANKYRAYSDSSRVARRGIDAS